MIRAVGIAAIAVVFTFTPACGPGGKSLAAADDAIRTGDDMFRAADDFTPPWQVRPAAPPPKVVQESAVSPVVSNAPSRVETGINELRESEIRELVQKAACALLKFELEYSEVPSAEEIEHYLGEQSDQSGLVWVTADDRQILASELESVGSEIADLGLPAEDVAALAQNVCEVIG